jgi:hypothetical protein
MTKNFSAFLKRQSSSKEINVDDNDSEREQIPTKKSHQMQTNILVQLGVKSKLN